MKDNTKAPIHDQLTMHKLTASHHNYGKKWVNHKQFMQLKGQVFEISKIAFITSVKVAVAQLTVHSFS
jgi:hypothetical protein